MKKLVDIFENVFAFGIIAIPFVVFAQFIVGILLALSYSDNIRTSFQSVSAIESGTFGSALRGFHYWGSAGVIVLSAIWIWIMIWRGQFTNSYKWLWWSLIGILGLSLITQITGNFLPISGHDVRTVVAESQIIGATPVIGPGLTKFVLNGNQVSQSTLDTWYFGHRYVFSTLLLLSSILLLACSKKSLRTKSTWLSGFFGIAIVFVWAIAIDVPIGNAATPNDFGTGATKPMWYILPLHALLVSSSNLNSSFGWIGAILLPVILLLFFGLLPLMMKERTVSASIIGKMIAGVLAVIFVLQLLSFGSVVQTPFTEPKFLPPIRPIEKPSLLDEALVAKGRDLFLKGACGSCHSIDGKTSGKAGPNLQFAGKQGRNRSYFVELIKNPGSKGFTRMPAFADLPKSEIESLAEFLRSLK